MKLKTIASDQKTISASSALFEAPLNEALLAQAVRVYLSNARQGTAKTKTRSEINRTHKKWYKQKGTGNARHGARNPNIFVGGGVSHGPTGEQNYNLKLSTKMRRQALISALSWQAEYTFVCDGLNQLDGKTKSAVALLKDQLQDQARVLVVVDSLSPEQRRSLSNIAQVLAVSASRLNALEVLNADSIIFTSEALKSLETRINLPTTKKKATT